MNCKFYPLFNSILDRAAIKIQAVFRGHQVRANMKKSDTKPAKSAPSAASASNSGPATADSEPQPSKAELEAEFDPNDKGKLYYFLAHVWQSPFR